jgi:very-short-patch-repair endonuclease
MRLRKPGHSRLQWRGDLLSALADIRAGVQSPLELRYLRDVERAHELPAGQRQFKTRRGSTVQFHDVRYVDFGVAVELDGVRWHSGDARGRDDARDNSSILDGFRTLRYGWVKVAYHPCEVAHEVWSLLVRQGYGTDFRRCGTDCALPRDAPVTVNAVLAQAKGATAATRPRST